MVGKRLHHERATEAHIAELLPQLRPADNAEVIAATGNLVEGCYNALCLSFDPIAMRDAKGGLIAVYGVAPSGMLSRDTAAPWLLGTERMRVNAILARHDILLYIEFLREHYDRLFNYVDARNEESVRWLEGVGFAIGEPVPRGPYGLLFHPFGMELTDA